MDEAKKQIVERLKQANNILVTVRNNPTVDLLCACIGLSLILDKMDKHAAAVFSGTVPNAIEFLKPEATIEQTPDSLRDFIIALDKSKADKLRYKVEDKVVRIFITPYKTSLSEDDLEFSQGDFNVDAVVALGAHEQQELDQAITVHGRILHDATVISVNNTPNGNLGSINWQEIGASSVSEMVTELVKDLHKEALDEQISTALLTGIVAETERFSNDKTTPRTMSLAGELMAAGANQQLVASSLQAASHTQEPADDGGDSTDGTVEEPSDSSIPKVKIDDGTLEIDHEAGHEPPQPERLAEPELPTPPVEAPLPETPGEPEPSLPRIITPTRTMLPTPDPSNQGMLNPTLQETPFTAEYEESPLPARSYLVDRPAMPAVHPTELGSSNTNPFEVPASEPVAPILQHDAPAGTSGTPPVLQQWNPMHQTDQFSIPPQPQVPPSMAVNVPSVAGIASNDAQQPVGQTLTQIEESVHSPHVEEQPHKDLDSVRGQVLDAFRDTQHVEPYQALNASPLGDVLHPHANTPSMGIEVDPEGNFKPADLPAGTGLAATDPQAHTTPLPIVVQTPAATVTEPPPVPPPMTPMTY